MKRFLIFVAIIGVAVISTIALLGCASTRIEHVTGAEFLKQAENTAVLQSFIWDSYIGSTDQRVYLEYGHSAFIGPGAQVTVIWTSLSELPSNVVAQINAGIRPWTNVPDRIDQGAGTQGTTGPKLYTKQEIVAAIPSPSNLENAKPMELIWAITETARNERELFVTVHGRSDYSPHVAAIYVRIGDKYKLLRKIDSAHGYFEKPKLFWITPDGSKDSEDSEYEDHEEYFILLSEIEYGTGYFTTQHVFCVLPYGDELQDVEFVPPAEEYASQLAPGEGVWKGEENDFSAQGLYFTFSIWKEGDSNSSPTAGQVCGAYKITAIDKGKHKYRISAKDYKRSPIHK